MISEQEYKEAIQKKDEAENVIQQFHREKLDSFDYRMKTNPIFTDDELIYSANSLCPCGYGLAYPKGCGPFHYWECSGILKGIADKSVPHSDRLPFAVYEIKSEQQPSANGMTTRGVFKPKPAEAV